LFIKHGQLVGRRLRNRSANGYKAYETFWGDPMTQSLADIRDAALLLGAEEREELAMALLDTLDDQELGLDGESEASLKSELDHRAEEARNDPGSLMNWDDVRNMR
jgi:putative addiction module component (TIGR02574 family)